MSLARNSVGFPASYVGAKWPSSVGAKSGVALSTSVQAPKLEMKVPAGLLQGPEGVITGFLGSG